jgi:CubicO group peptidase (beta-lactamase class C family)
MRLPLLIVAAVLAALPSAWGAAAATPWPPADAEIRQLLDQRLAAAPGGGIVVALVGSGGRQIIAAGTLGRGDPRPADGATVYWLASLTKVFTALLLCQMADAHDLSVNDPVAALLPKPGDELPRKGPYAITLADLATMTSGLPMWPNNSRSSDRRDPFNGYPDFALYEFATRAPPVPAARRHYAYSDVGYGLLGQALAHRGGADWETMIQTRIAGPLGLADIRADPTEDMRRRQAIEYEAGGAAARRQTFGAAAGAGALYGTANDLATLLEALLGQRPGPLAGALDCMLGTRRPGGQPPSTEAALGWNIYHDGPRELVWKDGYFHAFIGLDRAAGLGVVVLTNQEKPGGVNALGLHLLDPDFPLESGPGK